jgi:hypothetical protein
MRFVIAVVKDVLTVTKIVVHQRRLTGFQTHPCCPRFKGEAHAPYCGRPPMSSDSEPETLLGVVTPQCPTCDDTGWLHDPTACGDPDHCSPVYPCPDCNPEGES